MWPALCKKLLNPALDILLNLLHMRVQLITHKLSEKLSKCFSVNRALKSYFNLTGSKNVPYNALIFFNYYPGKTSPNVENFLQSKISINAEPVNGSNKHFR
jgi:hypothetical protein